MALSRKAKTALATCLYLLPGTLLMLAFVVAPVLLSFYMSFFQIPALGAAWTFAGLHNFGYLVRFGGWGLLAGTVFGLFFAFLICKHKLINTYRYIFYIPSVVSAVTMGRLWNYMLLPSESGFLNVITMKLLNLAEPVNWLGVDAFVPWVILGVTFYGAGGGMTLVLYTTAINNIPAEQIEAAKADGASPFTTAMKVQLPQIVPVISAMLILGMIGALKSFEGLYAIAPLSGAIDTIAVLLYKVSIGVSSKDGYGAPSAMGMVMTVFVMAVMSAYIFLEPGRKKEKKGTATI
jgi:ABC-type sugar transport system permease subunit